MAGQYQYDFTGQRVVITGGSRGLGYEMATAFSTLGATVAIAARKTDVCEAAAARITGATGNEVRPYTLNVTHWDELSRFGEQVWSDLGGVDVLVNNAGSSPLYDSLTGISEELFDKVLALNLKAPFRLSAVIGEKMQQRGGGSIINMSSVASTQPKPETVPYGAAKAGVNVMTESMAHAYGPEVRVNTIVPGTFLTDVSKHWDTTAFAERSQKFAAGRGGQPNEIVGAALYLASDMASYTTGSLLTVDGGARG